MHGQSTSKTIRPICRMDVQRPRRLSLSAHDFDLAADPSCAPETRTRPPDSGLDPAAKVRHHQSQQTIRQPKLRCHRSSRPPRPQFPSSNEPELPWADAPVLINTSPLDPSARRHLQLSQSRSNPVHSRHFEQRPSHPQRCFPIRPRSQRHRPCPLHRPQREQIRRSLPHSCSRQRAKRTQSLRRSRQQR